MIKDNGYQDVLVSIHPDVPGGSKVAIDELVKNIKTWIERGSEKLFKATKQQLYIGSVKILLPQAGDDSKWVEYADATSSDRYNHEDAWIRMETKNPNSGGNPYVAHNMEECYKKPQLGERELHYKHF